MIRLIIENTLLFLLPTAIYVAYVLVRRRIEGGTSNVNVLDDAPLIWLVAAGAALVVATLIIFGSVSGGKPGQTYHPSVYRDGRIEPGEIK